MRFLFGLFAALALLVAFVAAWEKEDHEIFDLVEAVETSEGKGTSFYSWLEVSDSATTAEINKAYRKKSIRVHPDKNPNLKNAHERFSRLGVVVAILRNEESRKRYDFFYKNGVPKWRGTGYYYSRFRPGISHVLIFLTLFTSIVQYIIQRFTYVQDLARVERIIEKAKAAAWGPLKAPATSSRKVKLNLSESEDGAGRIVDLLVEPDGTVYFLEPNGTQHLLDTNSAVPAAFVRTWAISLILSFVSRFTGGKKETVVEENNIDSDAEVSANEKSANGNTRAPATKAGGKRRKAIRKA